MTLEPLPTPNMARQPQTEDASFTAQLVQYHGRGVMVRGARHREATYSHQFVTPAYTWSEGDGRWRTDSIILGMSRTGERYLHQAKARISPIEQDELNRIVRSTLLGNCLGRPDSLYEVLSSCLRAPVPVKLGAFSAPIPLYHESGMYKDVFLFLGLALPGRSEHLLREIPLAIKISKAPHSITPGELEYHTRLSAAQGSSRTISQILKAFDLSNNPELGRPDQMLSLERFEAGATAGYFLARGLRTATALSVTRAVLRLTDLAIRAGLGSYNWSGCRHGCPAQPLLSVQFPSDINPGNFIIKAGGDAVLVDPGEHHPTHTSADILLRLIANYWTYPRGHDECDGCAMPLGPLFREVCSYYGAERGPLVLRELRVNLGFLRGTPVNSMRERFLDIDVDGIGNRLRQRYAESGDSGTARYISSAVRDLRGYYRRVLPEIESSDFARHERMRFAPKAIPALLFRDRLLETVSHELDTFLAGGASAKVVPLADKSLDRFRRSIKLSPVQERAALRRDLPAARATSPLDMGNGIVRGALFVTPFPDPSVVRLAMITAQFRRFNPREIRNTEQWQHYREVLLSCSAFLHHMFPDPGFTKAAADLVEGRIGAMYVAAARIAHRLNGPSRAEACTDLMRKWLSLLTSVEQVYFCMGGAKAVAALNNEIDPDKLEPRTTNETGTITAIVEAAGRHQEVKFDIGRAARSVIDEMAPGLCDIIIRRHSPRLIRAVPPFVVRQNEHPDRP